MGIQLIGDKMVRFIAWMPVNQVPHKMDEIVFGACVSAMIYNFVSGDIEARNQGLGGRAVDIQIHVLEACQAPSVGPALGVPRLDCRSFHRR